MINFELAFARAYPEVAAKGFSVRDDFSIFDGTGEDVAYDKAVVDSLVSTIAAEQDLKKAEANRAAAYAAEADPLFFKAQRGEATMDEWTAKVAEIKARFPYPGGEE